MKKFIVIFLLISINVSFAYAESDKKIGVDDANSIIGNYVGKEGKCEVRISEEENKILLEVFDNGKSDSKVKFEKEEFIKKVTHPFDDGTARLVGKKGDSKIFTQMMDLEISNGELKSVSAYLSQRLLPFVDKFIIFGGYYCTRLIKNETQVNNPQVNDGSRSQVKEKETSVEKNKADDNSAVLK